MRYISLAVATLLGAAALASAGHRPPVQKYKECGGFRIKPIECPKGQICIDDPYREGCGMACDMPGICVTPVFCGGFAGFACKGGKKCVDDPRDSCDPESGGADCGGICV